MAEWFFAAAIAVLLFPWARGRYQSWKYHQHKVDPGLNRQQVTGEGDFRTHSGFKGTLVALTRSEAPTSCSPKEPISAAEVSE